MPVADDSESSRYPDIFHLGPSSKCEWAVSDDNDPTITTMVVYLATLIRYS